MIRKDKKKKRISNSTPLQAGYNGVWPSRIRKLENAWAEWLTRKFNQRSRHIKWTMLAGYILLAGGACLHIVDCSLRAKQPDGRPLTALRMPAFVPLGENAGPKISPILSPPEYERIHRFHLYLDSLDRSAGGKRTYDSLIRAHPGLSDRLRFLEKWYDSQSKKK